MKNMDTSSAMEPLGGFQRTKESTFGAIGNIGGGVKQIITGTNGRLPGVVNVGLGILDLGDAGVSVVADGIRSLSGMPTGNTSGQFNITRAFKDYENIRTDDVMHTITDTTAYMTGLIHAVIFKPGSDLLRAISKR